ncbi:hypothetical protein D3C81_2264060 [compost metagenome]
MPRDNPVGSNTATPQASQPWRCWPASRLRLIHCTQARTAAYTGLSRDKGLACSSSKAISVAKKLMVGDHTG